MGAVPPRNLVSAAAPNLDGEGDAKSFNCALIGDILDPLVYGTALYLFLLIIEPL